MRDLVIRGGTVVTCSPSGAVVDADVVVHAGRIVSIDPVGSAPVGDGATVIDATNAAVIPGFVNAHMHECMERGVFEDLDFFTWLNQYALPKDRAYEPRHQRAAALLCQAEMIRNGTTSFIDIFRHPHEAAAVTVQSGLRGTISPQVIDEPHGAGETMASNEEFVETWVDRDPRVRPWFGPHSLYTVAAATFTRMREQADRFGVGIHTHLAESRGEVELVAELTGGLTPTAWLDRLVGLGPGVVCAHCVELDDDDLVRLAESRAGVAHCPTSNMKLGNGAARVVELLAAGATVGLGTDSVMTNNNLDPFAEMRQAGLLAKFVGADPTALPSLALLELATIGSARVLGLDDEVGSIEIGKAADLVVVDLTAAHCHPLVREGGGNVVEQLVWSCSGADVAWTIAGGTVLHGPDGLTTIDLAEVVDLADREERHLLASAGVLDHVTKRRTIDPPEGDRS